MQHLFTNFDTCLQIEMVKIETSQYYATFKSQQYRINGWKCIDASVNNSRHVYIFIYVDLCIWHRRGFGKFGWPKLQKSFEQNCGR